MKKIAPYSTWLGALLVAILFLTATVDHAEALTRSQVRSVLQNRTTTTTTNLTTSATPVIEQLISSMSAPIFPTRLSRNLSLGGRGEDVRTLQRFLIGRGLLGADFATGYFGRLTEAGVRKFQAAQGIASSGSAATTGWGAVGPRTRARIASLGAGSSGTIGSTSSALCDAHKSDLAPLYELLNGTTQQHFYTTSEAEKKDFISRLGFHDWGVTTYIYSRQIEGTVPLQRFKKTSSEDRVYTTHPNTELLASQGYAFEKIEGYAYPNIADGLFSLEQYHLSVDSPYAYAKNAEHAYGRSDLAWLYAGWGYVDEGVQAYACKGAPYIRNTTVLAFAGATLEISGSGFGDDPKSSDYRVTFNKGSNSIVVSSDSSEIISWADNFIKLRTPVGAASSYRASITAGTYGTSNSVPMGVYAYSSYPSYAADDPYGRYPLDIALDQTGAVWNISESTRGIESLTPAGKNVFYKDIQPANPIFYTDPASGGSGMTDISLFDEDVDVAANGDIWYTQGSDAYAEKGASRVVRVSPGSGTQRCYNIPQDGAGIIGVAVDDSTGTVWVSAGSLHAGKGNFIASFEPKTFTDAETSCTYDFISAPPAPWCASGKTDGCFTKYQLPKDNTSAAHIVKGPDGNIWFTEGWNSAIGMLDTVTKQITEFPLPKPSYEMPFQGSGYDFGSMPWQLAFDSSDNLWVNEYAHGGFVSFDIAARHRLSCTALDGAGGNPCMRRYGIIYSPSSAATWDTDRPHSIAVDTRDNVWFTINTYPADKGVGYIGLIDPQREMNFFPPLPDVGVTGGATGIVVDDKTNDIWFNAFWNSKVVHLRFIP